MNDCPNCRRMREALQEIIAHHIVINAQQGRDISRSHTIAVAKMGLDPGPESRGEVPLFLEGV